MSILTKTAKELLMINEDLPFRFDYSKTPRPTVDDFEMYTFTQTWGSTTLGFGGVGGQAFTTARTYVFVPQSCDEDCYVYFGGRFAYSVPYSEVLMQDIKNECVASVAEAGKYCG